MNPNDLHQLWDDVLNDVPTEAVAEPLWQSVQLGLRAERRRRRWVRASALAAALFIMVAAWRALPLARNEIVRAPQPAPQIPVIPPTVAPTLPTPEPSHLATTPPAPSPVPEPPNSQHVVLESVPLKEFLAHLPHHGFVEIKNERGRFLVVVDNETGETFTTVLSNDDQL